MFELDTEINSWCENLRSNGHLTEADIEELKDHLHCEIEAQKNNGLSIDQAYTIAVNKLGNTSELARAYPIPWSKPVKIFQSAGGYTVNPSKVTFDLYLVCTILFGWIFFTWITFFLTSLESNNGLDSLSISALYLAVIGAALIASAARKPLFLLVTSLICFILLGALMLEGEYWRVWTQLNAGASLLCLLLAIYTQKQDRNTTAKTGS